MNAQTPWHNAAGNPLSAIEWLNQHHMAKISFRRDFLTKMINQYSLGRNTKFIDIGCGPGLWLDLLNELTDNTCEFIGLDIDHQSIDEAKKISKRWERKFSLHKIDKARMFESVPQGDVYFLFNVLQYIDNVEEFIEKIKCIMNNRSLIVIRTFDGGLIRFGPVENLTRFRIDQDLYNSIGNSKQFNYYSFDQIFRSVAGSGLKILSVDVDVYFRVSPFDDVTSNYILEHLKWIKNYCSQSLTDNIDYIKHMFLTKNGYILENEMYHILKKE